ncbi:hypothetical protein [Sandaracinus amylolyticus]|uniref:hypothetical protein n=1 Tax=Sandaracinus amylolyticus TaxID=927083 RepID=UPI001F3701E5|nr:hypothetical protein [Sandaracinus amylolyticus]
MIASCGNDPENVAGTYTINLTNGPNACMFANWEEGSTVTGTTIAVTQDGESVTVNVEGLAGAYLDVVVGGNQFVGTVDGSHIDARLTGRAGTEGSCAYTFIVDLEGDLDGDVMEGTLTWFQQTNGITECGIRNSCQNTQAFNGTRPPGSGD